MTSPLEFNARAALCRRLAKLEPDSKNIWLAEAERWSRLTQKPGAAVVARLGEPVETWCWEVRPKRRPLDVKMTEVQFKLRNAAETSGEDLFGTRSSAMLLEAGKPN
jgi:hypothetical protein